jgi:hypothetical protein
VSYETERMKEEQRLRQLVTSVYKSDTWTYKVAHMGYNQLVAVYLSFRKRGLLP